METLKTSASDPIRVDWLPPIGAGRVGLTFAPGKRSRSLYSDVRWDRELTVDLDRLANDLGVSVLVSLIEDHELVSLGIPGLYEEAKARGIEVLRLPIRDTGTPESFAPVEALVRTIDARAKAGHSVAIHCAGGLGRTGTLAGCFLIDRGLSAAQALTVLHDTRGPRCPETVGQEAFLAKYARRERRAEPRADVPAATTSADVRRDRNVAVVLAAAIGDAMGHPTEFMSMQRIHDTFGPDGVTGFELYWERDGARFAPYTDDTQMAEAVLRTLLTSRAAGHDLDATMRAMSEAFVGWAKNPQGGHRAPGNACLAGCRALARGVAWQEAGGETAGGCGSVMRAYPFGLVFADDVAKAEAWAVAHSSLTHRDPIALAACAAMAVGVARLVTGATLTVALSEMVGAACRYSPKTAAMMATALDEAESDVGPEITLDRLRGWAAHEAIAAAVYVVRRHPNDLRAAVLEGANTPGDSDSIATLAGALVAARVGMAGVPGEWAREVERSAELVMLAKEI